MYACHITRWCFNNCAVLVCIVFTSCLAATSPSPDHQVNVLKQTNLLFIAFDDLRPELSVYGRNHMITPNFDRLASKSVVFDYAFCQIAVCNPSRDSLMTGLRPESTGSFAFQRSFAPNLVLPAQLDRSGYNTAAYGKIFHWEKNDKRIWNYDSWENGWYDFQNLERTWMNSSTMPDKFKPEEDFRDYQFTTKAIKTLGKLVKEKKYFMLAIGYKLPHLAVHMPHKYYEMYKSKTDMWRMSKKELRFPASTTEIGYRCCAEPEFGFMQDEGAVRTKKKIRMGDINFAFTNEMYDELMLGYCAAITFVDTQVGRLLDAVDKYQLWTNLTVVLTADHGMSNGEKGIWEKWNLFEETTRVPLMIAHPLSPFKGKHYKEPVELVDIFPTLNQLMKAPYNKQKVCSQGWKCTKLQGKSLVPVLLGEEIYSQNFKVAPEPNRSWYVSSSANAVVATSLSSGGNSLSDKRVVMPTMVHNMAITQVLRCAPLKAVEAYRKIIEAQLELDNKNGANISSGAAAGKADSAVVGARRVGRKGLWGDCDINKKNQRDEIVVMGYSMRTTDYRYTAYFYYNKTTERPDWWRPPYEQELYDHKNETLADFTHRETVNLAHRPAYKVVVSSLHQRLVDFLRDKMVYRLKLRT